MIIIQKKLKLKFLTKDLRVFTMFNSRTRLDGHYFSGLTSAHYFTSDSHEEFDSTFSYDYLASDF
jgi:hypothetical protein